MHKHIRDVKNREWHQEVQEVKRRNVRGIRLDPDGKIKSFLETLGEAPPIEAVTEVDDTVLKFSSSQPTSLEQRVLVLEIKMEEVEKFLVHHKTAQEFEQLKKEFPRLFKK